MIEKTMTRQLFELGNFAWAAGDELERAQEMKSIYDQLKPEKQQTFMKEFDYLLHTDISMFSLICGLLLPDTNETKV